jgi:hypothetical protein
MPNLLSSSITIVLRTAYSLTSTHFVLAKLFIAHPHKTTPHVNSLRLRVRRPSESLNIYLHWHNFDLLSQQVEPQHDTDTDTGSCSESESEAPSVPSFRLPASVFSGSYFHSKLRPLWRHLFFFFSRSAPLYVHRRDDVLLSR